MIIYTPPKAADHIPVIDLEGSFSDNPEDRKAVAWDVHKACRDTGFFYVKNHRVPREAMEGQIEIARDFFALPLEEKRMTDVSLSRATRGYDGLAAQTLDEGSPPDLKEGFQIGRDISADHPDVLRGLPGVGPNQWPARPSRFRAQFEDYVDQLTVLGRHLFGILALSLELPEDYFAEGLIEPHLTSRIHHYPRQPPTAAFNQLGAGAHTDWGMITMLLQDAIGGLEVLNADGDWIRAPYIPDTFVINLGEMVPILTNGLYHATTHRVLNNVSEQSRYSCATFFDPNYAYRVTCVPTCLPAGGFGPAAELTVGEHIAEMNRKTYGRAA